MPAVPRNELEEGGRGEVADDRAGAAGLRGGEETSFEGRVRMPDGVHLPVQRVEPTPADADPDRVPRQPALAKLLEREDAPRTGRPKRHADIGPSVACVGLRPTHPTLGAGGGVCRISHAAKLQHRV